MKIRGWRDVTTTWRHALFNRRAATQYRKYHYYHYYCNLRLAFGNEVVTGDQLIGCCNTSIDCKYFLIKNMVIIDHTIIVACLIRHGVICNSRRWPHFPSNRCKRKKIRKYGETFICSVRNWWSHQIVVHYDRWIMMFASPRRT